MQEVTLLVIKIVIRAIRIGEFTLAGNFIVRGSFIKHFEECSTDLNKCV